VIPESIALPERIVLDEAGALPSASPFAHVSINRGGGRSLADPLFKT
jgi:hypothetical protein